VFDIDCRICPRLACFLDDVKRQYPEYHARPVPPFGDSEASLLIVGLAPGMHGANATGRPFTGDHAGILLYETIYKFGFSSSPVSKSIDDGLELRNCRITNAVKCLPPQNKPIGSEINSCNSYLCQELEQMPTNSVILALGSIAHNSVIKAFSMRQKEYKFGHNRLHQIKPGLKLLDSYHCSRYNTQTKRLTPEMFEQVFAHAKELLG
jgi:uracil-DNA glycosylase family 4